MSLPGKLCIGILEEDNPLRSYFRLKPLLIDENGRYTACEDLSLYGDEGCIRIVPDRNEAHRFKARMRETGLFCVVDLREHPEDHGKIRPNKNYRPGGEEINANIIYSDVVHAPAEDMIYEILPADAGTHPLPEPATARVLLRDGDKVIPVPRGWESIPDSDGMVRLTGPDAEAIEPDALQIFDLTGFRDLTVSFAIRPAGTLSRVSLPPEAPVPPVPDVSGETKREAEPVRPVPAPAPEPEKPWIHRDHSIQPHPVDNRLSRSERIMAAQVGLNPRRGRSLQELIDEKWQRSRINQLGQSVSDITTGAPVQSPVEAAIEALRSAWRQPELQQPLLDAIGKTGAFGQMLRERMDRDTLAAADAQLNALEAQKLELLGELDRLKAGRDEVRSQLKQEVRREEASGLAEAVRRTQAAREEQARCEALAAEARAAAQDARATLEHVTDDALESRLLEDAFVRRVTKRLRRLERGAGPDLPPPLENIDFPAFVDRVTRHFASEGWRLTADEAANLCVCFVLSPALLFTGAPGSGKSTAARLMAEALGAGIIRIRGEAVKKCPADCPTIYLFDDANRVEMPDPLHGLGQELVSEQRIIATLQDAHSGVPVSAPVWDSGFAVRLTASDDLPWRPAPKASLPPETPVSIAHLTETMPMAEVPAATVERMEQLRVQLRACGVRLSRRALNDAWRYTAAMTALTGEEADANLLLDRAFAQRLMPALLSAAPVEALIHLKTLLGDMPACIALLGLPLPIRIE